MRYVLILLSILFITGSSFKERYTTEDSVFSCEKCNYIVRRYNNDAGLIGIKPGDIICFESGFQYKGVKLKNIKGTKLKPVIIRNCGGVATIPSALKFENSSHFKLVGDGTSEYFYGIKVSTPRGFFITFDHFTSEFEVTQVEVAGYNKNGIGQGSGFAGIGIKTSPYQNCKLFTDSTRQAWIMRNVSVHHNYIHDTGGEGLYIGHGFYKGRKEKNCDSITYSHSIKGLRIHHNIVENTGWDGMQIKNADEDCEIYNNIIRNFGTQHKGGQNHGLFLGEGVTGKVYNNLIDTGSGHGISLQGMGNNDIFNNIILNAGKDGFNCSGSAMGFYIPDGYFKIFNNTIYNSGDNGFAFYHNRGGIKIVKNNMVIKAKRKLHAKGGTLEMSNNIFTQDSSIAQSIQTKAGKVVFGRYYPAIDKGTDVRKFNPGITFDFYNKPRPQGKAFDIGAIEFE